MRLENIKYLARAYDEALNWFVDVRRSELREVMRLKRLRFE